MMTYLTKWRSARMQTGITALLPDGCGTALQEHGRGERPLAVAVERRNGGVRRAQPGQRRRRVDPTTCERVYNADELDFMKAMDRYRRDNRRPFPTLSETLEVLEALGYRKVAARAPLPGL